jgi:hypothetical protein
VTPAEKRARRAWHRAILAVAPDRPTVEPWTTWHRAALAWHRDIERRRIGRYKRLELERSDQRPTGRLVGLRTRGERRAAIRAAVRERWAA